MKVFIDSELIFDLNINAVVNTASEILGYVIKNVSYLELSPMV